VAEGQQSREDDALGLSRGVLSFSLCNADPSRQVPLAVDMLRSSSFQGCAAFSHQHAAHQGQQ